MGQSDGSEVVERLTERIGRERVAQRDLSLAEWEAAPRGVNAPAVVCVSADGGRMQRCDLPSTAQSHWCEDKCEDKIGALFELQPNPHTSDPCPQIPGRFLDVATMAIASRDLITSLANSTTFGKQLAARAWSLGFAAAPLKAFIAAGSPGSGKARSRK